MKILRTLDKVEFQGARRELLLDFDLYSRMAANMSMRIPRVGVNLADPVFMKDKGAAEAMSMTRNRADNSAKFFVLNYSAGLPLSELRDWYPIVLDYWEEFAQRSREFDDGPESEGAWVAHISLQGTEFYVANAIVCIGILLGWGHTLSRFASIVDYRNPQKDGLLERLMQFYVSGRERPPDECTKHLPYFKTLKIFKAEPHNRPNLMAQYLAEWYVASRREPYYDSHSRGTSFTGYWCWDAAALTFLLDIDDSSYTDAMFYPRDLVDFARQARRDYLPPAFAAPVATEWRAKAGDRCPKSGIWESLTIPAQVKKYAEGDIIEDVRSPYGITVWKLPE